MRPTYTVSALLRTYAGTVCVILFCMSAFAASFLYAGSFEEAQWTSALLRFGGLFNPLTLHNEWYRVITHLFLHGSVVHLAVNAYLLAFVGHAVERTVGTAKFLSVFLVCGLAAAMNGLYWGLFTIGVGSSGAICGLLGFALVRNMYFSGSKAAPMVVLLLHFASFAIINLLLPEAMFSDYAAQFGGVITGIVLGFLTFSGATKRTAPKVKFEYLIIAFLFIGYFLLPRNQVRYFTFFRQVVAAEDSARHRYKENLTEDQYMRGYILNYHQWDDVLNQLQRQTNLPVQLATDTFKLRRYIALRKEENLFRKLIVQQEAYVYLDSVDRLQGQMKSFTDLRYGLWSWVKPDIDRGGSTLPQTIVYYDSNAVEVDSSRACYYRIGYRDSLGRWNGSVQEFYLDTKPKMKGRFATNKRDGIFLYYFKNSICAEAGRYIDDRRFGKWETFHENGKLASEVYYNNFYFVKSVWDSLGTQLVIDGNGVEVQRYADGVVAVEGEYRHGLREGVWRGRYPNGDLHYEETYVNGRLISGKSRNPQGETFVYDHTILSPVPDGGFDRFAAYLKAEAAKVEEEMGHVKLSFRVTRDGRVADLKIDQGASAFLDQKARQIILNGPRWHPARDHGYLARDEVAFVQVAFY